MPESGSPRPGHRTEGAALVTALLAAVAITLLMFALTSLRVSEVRAIANTTQFTQAQMAAEAGIESAIALIRTNGAVPEPELEIEGSLAGATYAATATTGTDPDTGEDLITVVSRGEYADAVRTLETQLQAIYSNELLDEYALLVCHDLVLTGSANVVGGDIYSGGNLTISKTSGLVNGDARAKLNILLEQELAVTGNVTSQEGSIDGTKAGNKVVASGDAFVRPSMVDSSLSDFEVGGTVIGGDPDLPDYCGDLLESEVKLEDSFFAPPPPDGGEWENLGEGPLASTDLPTLVDGTTYYVDGDLTLASDFDANVTFVVDGELRINGGVTVGGTNEDEDEDTSGLAFAVAGDVVRANGNATINGVLYSNGSITGNGNLVVNGSAILADTDNDSSLSGNFTINYQKSTNTDLPNVVLSDVETTRWRIISN